MTPSTEGEAGAAGSVADGWLEVGRIVKPHGIRGEVIVDLVSNRPDLRLVPGAELRGPTGTFEVLAARSHQGRWIVGLAGVKDRNRAEALREVPLQARGVAEKGTLWVHELVGAMVVDAHGAEHGLVRAVEAQPASDCLVLDGDRLVPLVFVVSHEPGVRVVVDPPAGLLD